MSFATKSEYLSSWKIHFLGDLLGNGILGEAELWILFPEILGTGFNELINWTLFTFCHFLKDSLQSGISDINNYKVRLASRSLTNIILLLLRSSCFFGKEKAETVFSPWQLELHPTTLLFTIIFHETTDIIIAIVK